MDRSPELQLFLDKSAAALRGATSDRAAMAAEKAIRLWSRLEPMAELTPKSLPVCDWVEPALAEASSSPRAGLARAFKQLLPRLGWQRRPSADPTDTDFWNGHANAMILGPGGLEPRSDLWVGATIMAPGVTYADHDHPPEEVYLSLSAGEWWNQRMDWTDPGFTGSIYNPPGIRHAMRAGKGPFLALWYLPI